MKKTKVYQVSLYAKNYPIAFYVTDFEMISIHTMMQLDKKKRGQFAVRSWNDLNTLRNKPDNYFILDLDASVIFGYSFIDVGYFDETHEEVMRIAEGIH